MARLQAPVGSSKRFVVTVILEDEVMMALGAGVIKDVVIAFRHVQYCQTSDRQSPGV